MHPPSPQHAWIRLLPQAGLACAVVVCLVLLFGWLERIPDEPVADGGPGGREGLLRLGFWVSLVVAVVGGLSIARAGPAWSARHASRAAGLVIAACVCWWLPVPFAVTRLASFLLLGLAAASAAAVALASGSSRLDRRVGPVVACAAVATSGAAASGLLLGIRLNALGWNAAID